MKKSLGEERVGVIFNPSGSQRALRIKNLAAKLIDVVNEVETENGEVHRLKALAMTAIEEGAMWGVKAAVRSEVRDDG